jgi:bacteriocin-like protein
MYENNLNQAISATMDRNQASFSTIDIDQLATVTGGWNSCDSGQGFEKIRKAWTEFWDGVGEVLTGSF